MQVDCLQVNSSAAMEDIYAAILLILSRCANLHCSIQWPLYFCAPGKCYFCYVAITRGAPASKSACRLQRRRLGRSRPLECRGRYIPASMVLRQVQVFCHSGRSGACRGGASGAMARSLAAGQRRSAAYCINYASAMSKYIINYCLFVQRLI